MKFNSCGFLLVSLFFCNKLVAQSFPLEVVKFDWVENLRSKPSDTTYVLNFWATWCVPCVEELPAFEKIHHAYLNKKVKVILVSLDFVKSIEKNLKPFLTKKKIESKVVVLNESDPNSYIDKIDKQWSGALPATLVFRPKNGKYQFLEKQLTFEELNFVIQNISKK